MHCTYLSCLFSLLYFNKIKGYSSLDFVFHYIDTFEGYSSVTLQTVPKFRYVCYFFSLCISDQEYHRSDVVSSVHHTRRHVSQHHSFLFF